MPDPEFWTAVSDVREAADTPRLKNPHGSNEWRVRKLSGTCEEVLGTRDSARGQGVMTWARRVRTKLDDPSSAESIQLLDAIERLRRLL